MPTGHRVSEETVQYVIQHYADTQNKDLCSLLGISKSTIDRICGKYHLKKTREHYRQMAIKAGKASSKARGGKALNITPESLKKRGESYKDTVRREYIRVKYGMKQRTKIRLRKEPRASADQRIFLQKRGYIIDNIRKIAYWTDDTNRSWRMERRGPNGRFKNYFTFIC